MRPYRTRRTGRVTDRRAAAAAAALGSVLDPWPAGCAQLLVSDEHVAGAVGVTAQQFRRVQTEGETGDP